MFITRVVLLQETVAPCFVGIIFYRESCESECSQFAFIDEDSASEPVTRWSDCGEFERFHLMYGFRYDFCRHVNISDLVPRVSCVHRIPLYWRPFSLLIIIVVSKYTHFTFLSVLPNNFHLEARAIRQETNHTIWWGCVKRYVTQRRWSPFWREAKKQKPHWVLAQQPMKHLNSPFQTCQHFLNRFDECQEVRT